MVTSFFFFTFFFPFELARAILPLFIYFYFSFIYCITLHSWFLYLNFFFTGYININLFPRKL